MEGAKIGKAIEGTQGSGAFDAFTSPTSSKTGLLVHREQPQSHPLQDRNKLLRCIKLLDAGKLSSLPSPFPRAQDIPRDYFGLPSASDEVVSVSHAWRNQAHPDPTCSKMRLLAKILEETGCKSAYLFLDFMSIPQRPFRPDQAPRTEEELFCFRSALSCMHEMYFYSDRIIHLPWDDAGVEAEGAELTVAAADLQGAAFTQMGDVVQISALESGSSPSPRGPSAPQLFDQVVAVDSELVKSHGQLDSLLGACAGSVRLRRYPVGLVNSIPAHERGWLFLERFITMVKCAMVDQSTARKVVITPEEALHEQIMQGADKLREAALKDLSGRSGRGELQKTLDEFTQELNMKRFAAASTDKREMELCESIRSDHEVVRDLMQSFAEHIANHWEAEAARQRSLTRRLSAAVKATQKFALEWDCFSEAHAAKLEAASTGSPWPVLALFVGMTVPCVWLMLLPYERPGIGGWESQSVFWVLGSPVWTCSGFLGTVVWFGATLDVKLAPHGAQRFVAVVVLFTLLVSGAHVAIAAALDTFPVPLNMLVVALVPMAVPMLWYCISEEQRASTEFRWRAGYSFLGFGFIAGVLATGFLLLNAAIPHVSTGMQSLLLCLYLVAKLAFELVGVKMSKRLGADMMPYFVLVGTVCYQMNLCVAFSKVSSWWLVMQQISFDVVENVYHLYSIQRQRHGERRVRHEQYIVSSLAFREFLEVASPAQFLAVLKLLEWFRPEFSELICHSGSDARQVQAIVGLDIAVELFVSFLTYLVLVRGGHSPLRLLRGLIATRLGNLLLLGCSAAGAMLIQHTHFGMELTFKWLWIFEADAEWECGLTWASAAK